MRFPAAFHLTLSLKAILFRHRYCRQLRHGFKAGLSRGGPEGEAQEKEGCVPAAPASPVGAASPGTGRLWPPATPLRAGSPPPEWVCGFPGKCGGTGLLGGDRPGMLFLQTLFVPLAQSSALRWGVGSPLRQGPVTSRSFASPFYLPAHLNLFFSPVALCGVAEDKHTERWVTPAVTSPILGGHWGSPRVCLWG